MSSKIVGTDVAGSPKIFFTAAVAGCSVFVVGSPANPTVFHAGIDGMIDAKVYPAVQGDDPQAALEKMLVGAAKSKDAPMFWRVLLSKLVPETLDDKDIGETNKEHYMEEGKHGKEIYAPFLARMKDKAKTAGMTLTFSTGYGCIFGVNKGSSITSCSTPTRGMAASRPACRSRCGSSFPKGKRARNCARRSKDSKIHSLPPMSSSSLDSAAPWCAHR
jgi:hypothetical protein